MRVVSFGALFLATSALLGCSSPSVPTWAVASRYPSEKHLVERIRPKTTQVSSHDPIASHDAAPGGRKIDDTKILKVNDPPATDSTLSEGDPRKALRELDRRQAEENRELDAALAICRC
jgi:hypothetical protein